jgi:hypothetical protein
VSAELGSLECPGCGAQLVARINAHISVTVRQDGELSVDFIGVNERDDIRVEWDCVEKCSDSVLEEHLRLDIEEQLVDIVDDEVLKSNAIHIIHTRLASPRRQGP